MFCTAVNLVQEETSEDATSEQSGFGPYSVDCRLSDWCTVIVASILFSIIPI